MNIQIRDVSSNSTVVLMIPNQKAKEALMEKGGNLYWWGLLTTKVLQSADLLMALHFAVAKITKTTVYCCFYIISYSTCQYKYALLKHVH